MSRAAANKINRWIRGNCKHSKFARLRRWEKLLTSRIRRREDKAYCAGHGPEPRPRHTAGLLD